MILSNIINLNLPNKVNCIFFVIQFSFKTKVEPTTIFALREDETKIGIHLMFLNGVKECITIPSFSMIINGKLEGFFKSLRGLCQDDLTSAYLFMIVMEVLFRILEDMALKRVFEYKWKCKESKITHFCFANGLLNFWKVEEKSI